jgi:hypothetical protein
MNNELQNFEQSMMRREDAARAHVNDDVKPLGHLSATTSRSRATIYRVTTLILATECVVGGVMGILRLPPRDRL